MRKGDQRKAAIAGRLSGRPFPPYDDESRLTFMEYDDYGTPYYQLNQAVYDGLGRLRAVAEYIWDGSQWNLTDTKEYIYDGWRVIQERDGNNNPMVSYTRGNDLSGSLEGAGGIGGLLARSCGYSLGNWTTNDFYFADGNGNITYMTDGNQAMVAQYRYDPYGNELSVSGSLAPDNSYRFSSKEIIAKPLEEYGALYYYGYRVYDPFLQRWPNRDPLTEPGSVLLLRVWQSTAVPAQPNAPAQAFGEDWGDVNLYAFVANSPTITVDIFGLKWWPPSKWPFWPKNNQKINPTVIPVPSARYGHLPVLCPGVSIGRKPPQRPDLPPEYFWPPLDSPPLPGDRR